MDLNSNFIESISREDCAIIEVKIVRRNIERKIRFKKKSIFIMIEKLADKCTNF